MLTVRISLLLLATATLASSVAAQSKPYSPDLYDRSILMAEDGSESSALVARGLVKVSRPYAPDLYDRQSLIDNDEVERDFVESDATQYAAQLRKRSLGQAHVNLVGKARSADAVSPSATWNLFSKRDLESEESLHARGLVSDEEINARGWCGGDRDCNGDQYCSSTKHKCYRKIGNSSKCSRDGACGSGYCCESSGVCEATRKNGERCHNKDNACDSGYCSVVSDKCYKQGDKGDNCRVDQGCKGSLSCVNGSCKDSHPSKPSKPQHPKPDHPHPSGSPNHRRSLRHTEV